MTTQNTTATSSIMSNGTSHNRTTSKTAPARLEGFDDDEEEDNALFKVHLHGPGRNRCAQIDHSAHNVATI